MALTALSGLYTMKDGERVDIPAGEKVPSGVFTKEELARFKEQGSIGEPPVAAEQVDAIEAENADLRAKVAELEAQLDAAKNKKPPTS